MLKAINHIGIAVTNLEASIETFRKLFGFEDIHRETVEKQKVNVASFNVGEVKIELTSPTDEESPIAKFIAKRGEGIHHIAFETDNIEGDLEHLKEQEVRLINDTPQIGAHEMLIAFLHPKSTNGVLTEICQPQDH